MRLSIFSQIELLAHEQQHLWKEARHKHLKSEQQQRLRSIKTELDRLWHVYRCELAEVERLEWRRTSKACGNKPDVLHWEKGDLDSFSVGDMQSLLRIEYTRLKRRGFSSLDQKWETERQRLDATVFREMQAETAENRRIQQVLSATLTTTKPFNPHEMSLRQLRQHRLQPHREFSLVGTL